MTLSLGSYRCPPLPDQLCPVRWGGSIRAPRPLPRIPKSESSRSGRLRPRFYRQTGFIFVEGRGIPTGDSLVFPTNSPFQCRGLGWSNVSEEPRRDEHRSRARCLDPALRISPVPVRPGREPLNGPGEYRYPLLIPRRLHWSLIRPNYRDQTLAIAGDRRAAPGEEGADSRGQHLPVIRGGPVSRRQMSPSMPRATPLIRPARPSRPGREGREVSGDRVTNYGYPGKKPYLSGKSAFNRGATNSSSVGKAQPDGGHWWRVRSRVIYHQGGGGSPGRSRMEGHHPTNVSHQGKVGRIGRKSGVSPSKTPEIVVFRDCVFRGYWDGQRGRHVGRQPDKLLAHPTQVSEFL